jgi:hypothetical protein
LDLLFDTCASALAAALSLDGGRIEIYTAIGAVLGVFLFYRGFRMLQYKRLIQNTPFSKIRSASMGLVEVSGMATGPQTIPAGITGEPCFYYRATAWEMRESGNRREWKQVADESLYVPFFVGDPTGKMLVDAQGADLDVHRTFKDQFNTSLFGGRDMVPASVTKYLLRNGIGASGELRLEEHCIQPGYPLFILGTLGENPDRSHRPPAPHVAVASSSIRSRASMSFSLGNRLFQSVTGMAGLPFGASTAQNPVSNALPVLASAAAESVTPVRPATPAAGKWSSVSMDEVHPPGRTASTPAPPEASILQVPLATATALADAPTTQMPPVTQRTEESAFDASVVIGKGTRNDPFTISSQSQREVVQSLGWKSALCIWGGPVLTLVCLYILLGMLGRR